MAKQLFANNVSTQIMEFLSASDTTITVSSTSRFPSLGTGDWIMATIVPQGGQGSPEVVKITAISGNDLTVVRAQEGTTAQSFLYGSLLELRVTKGSLEWLRDHPNIINVQTDFGAVGDGTTDDTVAIQNAIDALKVVTWPELGQELWFPPGTYRCNSALTLDGKGATFRGYGATLDFRGSVGLDIGAASYLTDLAAGYHAALIDGFRMLGASGTTTIIRNRGYRKVILQNIQTSGGVSALETEGAFANSTAVNCRFQSTSSHAVNLKQRNNLFSFYSCAFLTATSNGINFNTSGAELKGIKLIGCDFEGNTGAINITGQVSNIIMDGCWFENNTSYNIRIDNTTGTSNKEAISIRNCQITGAGVDVLIGTDATGTLIQGVSVQDNEFVDSDLIVIGAGDKVFEFTEFNNRYAATATKTIPAAAISASGIPASSLMPRYATTPTAPFGTSAAGIQGDFRYEASRAWIKNANGWHAVQTYKVADATNPEPLPAGTTPNVTGLRFVHTNNGGATTITSFSSGVVGQDLILVGRDGGNTTVADGANIALAGNVNFTLGDDDTLYLICLNGTKWVEVARANN